jgi:hypothetical protein
VSGSLEVAILNQSNGLVTDDDCAKMADAAQVSLGLHYAEAYNEIACHVAFYKEAEARPKNAAVFVIGEQPPDDGELGHHDETQKGIEEGFAYAAPVLQNGGGVLDLGSAGVSLFSVLDHELKEWKRDPNTNLWRDTYRDDFVQTADEVSDPVEMNSYPIKLPTGVEVWASDFVLQAYFDPQAPAGSKLTYCDAVKSPFELAPGGYMVVRTGGPGTEQQIFHRDVRTPQWKLDMKSKNPRGRSARRLGR